MKSGGCRAGRRQLAMITPIYNEPACSQVSCHAHPEKQSVLGVLDVALDLNRIDKVVVDMERRSVAVTVIAVVLIAVLISLFTRHFVSTPIRKLVAGTRAVSEMQMDTPIRIETSQELGELAHSFNIMRERLGTALSDLNKLAADLESKVDQRTRQLKAAHLKLIHSDRLASLGQRCPRDQQPPLGRPQPLHAVAADSQGQRHPVRARAGGAEVPHPDHQRDLACGKDRF